MGSAEGWCGVAVVPLWDCAWFAVISVVLKIMSYLVSVCYSGAWLL